MRLDDLRYNFLSHILKQMEENGGKINCNVTSQLTKPYKDGGEEVIGKVEIETSITITKTE